MDEDIVIKVKLCETHKKYYEKYVKGNKSKLPTFVKLVAGCISGCCFEVYVNE